MFPPTADHLSENKKHKNSNIFQGEFEIENYEQ